MNDEPWFVASDVCRFLDVSNTTQAVQALDDNERSMFNIGRLAQPGPYAQDLNRFADIDDNRRVQTGGRFIKSRQGTQS